MSQHDYDISTADANTGVTMRAAINAALQALAGNNSGATEPATKYPYMWWADTTSGYLKQRNAANTAWITVMLLATALMSNSDACDGFHASQTAAAGSIPVTAATTGNLPLINGAAVSWGDGSCNISGSGATDIITAICTTFIHDRQLAVGANKWFTANINTSGQVGLLWFGQLDPSDSTKFIGTHPTVPATRFYANSSNDFFWAHAPNNGIGGELTFTARMSFQADTGRLLLGPTLPTDNGVDALQVNGTIASKGLKLSDTNEILWGDGSCKISGSGSTDIITLTGSSYFTGNVGVKTSAQSNTSLKVVNTTSGGTNLGIHSHVTGTITESQVAYTIGIDSGVVSYQINEGVTQSGYIVGGLLQSYIASADNRGTLTSQYGVHARTGIYNTGVGGTVTNSYAVYADMLNSSANGTITNAYGVYINNKETTGTITNRWGLYQVGALAKNYFQGDVLIGTTTSDGVNKLQVDGTISSTGYKLSALNTAPASASATGTLGEIRITADAIYICTATNTWKKVAIATW